MKTDRSIAIALAGLLAMAAAMGIGRFVYTPILPAMIEALGWSKADAGFVASANFLGYLAGALVAAHPAVARSPRGWLVAALAGSAATTAGMALVTTILPFAALRFAGGVASAFVIVCSSTLVLARLAASGRASLSAIHFAGVGFGILVSAIVVSALLSTGAGWRALWMVAGLISVVATFAVAMLLPAGTEAPVVSSQPPGGSNRGQGAMIIAYGLFGFGYVITATFIVTMVRASPEARSLEPWVWALFGAAAVPSVAAWVRLGGRVGILPAFTVAALVEAAGVAISVGWDGALAAAIAATLLGGTFMGLTALGLMIGRSLSGGDPQRSIGRMTASFGLGQMIGPLVGGHLYELTGSFRLASHIAVAALVLAAALAWRVHREARLAR